MRYRHKKRGTEYELLGFGKTQAERSARIRAALTSPASAAIYANTKDLALVAAICQPGTCVAHGKDIAFYIGAPPAQTGYTKLITPLYATPEPRRDGVMVTDEVLRTALEAWNKLAGYGKMERMRAALDAALNPGGHDAK